MTDKPITMIQNSADSVTMQKMAEDVVHTIIEHFMGLKQRDVLERITEVPKVTTPLSWEETLDVMRTVLRHSMQLAHPRFFGHMDSGPLFVSALADWVATTINQNMLSEELSPLATKIEEEVIKWFCELCGYDDGEGTLVSGGTMANFTALLMSLHNITQGEFRNHGIWSLSSRPIVFASDQAHYSVQKALHACGLGVQSLKKIATDNQFRMDVEDLSLAMKRTEESGQLPLLVVATAGTTSTGSVDPIVEIADVCQQYGVWLHVDAAHGGAVLTSLAAQKKLIGIDRADSITIDPHKWLMQPKSMGVILSRHKELLQGVFKANAPYLQHNNASSPASRSAMSFQGSRRFDALRIWITRAYLGQEVLGNLIEHNLRQTAMWASLLREAPCIEMAHEPELNILCFRYRSKDISEDRLDSLNERIQRSLLTSGTGYVSITTLKGHRWLRSVFINPDTTEVDMRTVLDEIQRQGDVLQRNLG